MDEIKKQLNDSKESIKRNIKNIQTVLGNLYLVNTKKINNKLIFIKRGVDKANLANKYLSSLNLSYSVETNDLSDVKEALKETMLRISKLENILESKFKSLKGNSDSTSNFRRDMDSLRLAYNCLKNLDTDMTLSVNDLDKNDMRDFKL